MPKPHPPAGRPTTPGSSGRGNATDAQRASTTGRASSVARPGRPRGAYTQYRRLRQLRELLEGHPKGLSIEELATRLKVTDRSVRRYLRELEREVDVERAGRVETSGGPRVKIPTRDLPRRVKLHRTQIYGLLTARRVFHILDGTAFEETLREAVDQLLSHVQRPPRRGATIDPDTRLEDRFLYLPANPPRPMNADAAEIVDTMIDACAQLRECSIRYRKPNGASESLTVHPYAIVLYRDAIYCVCFVKERDAVRTLRMDRIVDADASPTRHFPLPDDFSVDRHFAGHFGMHAGDVPVRVVIDFDKSVVELVRGRTYPSESIAPIAGGGVRLSMQTAITPELRGWIFSFGGKARVVEPASLAGEIAGELRNAAAAYGASAEGKRPKASQIRT